MKPVIHLIHLIHRGTLVVTAIAILSTTIASTPSITFAAGSNSKTQPPLGYPVHPRPQPPPPHEPKQHKAQPKRSSDPVDKVLKRKL